MMHANVPMPLPPASLASNCPELPPLPEPLLDPERLVWEINVTTLYGQCAAKHREAIEGWLQAIEGAAP